MTRLANGHGEDYPEAAVRHFDDARGLALAARYDSALYHLGFSIECALKSCILVGTASTNLGKFKFHDLSALSGEVLRLATYAFGTRVSLPPTAPIFAILDAQAGSSGKWVDMRYRGTGMVNQGEVMVVEQAARLILRGTIGSFYASGDLP